jgi:hypothetical protein
LPTNIIEFSKSFYQYIHHTPVLTFEKYIKKMAGSSPAAAEEILFEILTIVLQPSV